MAESILSLLWHWGLMSLSLWVASRLFAGVRFADTSALLVSALVLGMVNSVLRPVLILFTLPLSILSLGLFVLVINAGLLLLVSALVRGFYLSGFWTAFFASLWISFMNMALDINFTAHSTPVLWPHSAGGTWL